MELLAIFGFVCLALALGDYLQTGIRILLGKITDGPEGQEGGEDANT